MVTGGDRIFAAGAEISEFRSTEDPAEVITRAEAEHLGQLFLRALNAVADIPRATIAAISGFALGGGCELALACDFRIASEKAKLGQPEILLGIIPGGGGTQRLARLVGPARAKDLIFTGRQVRADEALAIGPGRRGGARRRACSTGRSTGPPRWPPAPPWPRAWPSGPSTAASTSR